MSDQEKNKHLANLASVVDKAVGTYAELTELRKSFNAIQTELLKKDEKVITDINSSVG